MKPGLLDINVLIALLDPEHEFHDAAHDWFARNRRHGWATCPLTENGCLRILSKPSYPFSGMTVASISRILTELTRLEGHRFWGDTISMLDPDLFDLTGAGPKQITDLYLLALALACGGKLITFDRNIRYQTITGSTPEDLEVLPG